MRPSRVWSRRRNHIEHDSASLRRSSRRRRACVASDAFEQVHAERNCKLRCFIVASSPSTITASS